MNTIRTLSFAAVAALSLGIGTAMAQESPGNDTMSGATWPPPAIPAPEIAGQPQHSAVQSGSSDVQTQPSTTTNGRPFWTPGVAY
jgi:hypothetical protein